MVESGPASGIWGAAELGRLIGEPNVLALDIGGTTAKCSLIEGGHVRVISDYWIERSRLSAGYPIMVPVVDLVEIGNGGGSIAWVDDFGKLHVGPRLGRRGARPGRVRPRRDGGDHDRREPRSSAGSTATTSAAARSRPTWTPSAGRSTRLPARLGVDRAEAARGVVRIANNNMVNALKLISVNRGYDPRDFTLVAFGGGGGMHAVALAAGARDPQGRDPARRGRLLGVGDADERPPPRLLPHPPRSTSTPENAGRLEGVFASSEQRRSRSSRPRGSRPSRSRSAATANLRYTNQEHGVEIALPEAIAPRRGGDRGRRSTRPTSASTPTASTRPSSSSAATWSRSPRSASSSRRGCR